jgi:hypothetical protein
VEDLDDFIHPELFVAETGEPDDCCRDDDENDRGMTGQKSR